jgi:phosphate transport system protein
MLRELLSIFRSGNPLSAMGENFARMLKLAYELTDKAGEIYFGKTATPEERTYIYKQDVRVNKLERKIRKQVVAHLSISGNTASVPYCLFLMSLVKDVERIGDYAKNLAEVVDIRPDPLPDDEIVAELREIRAGVESTFEAASEVFAKSDHERAVELMSQGKDLAHRSDALIGIIARKDYDASTTTAVVLGTRYYKRIGGHVMNILSSVVMPLHKLDYYDEKAVVTDEVSAP